MRSRPWHGPSAKPGNEIATAIQYTLAKRIPKAISLDLNLFVWFDTWSKIEKSREGHKHTAQCGIILRQRALPVRKFIVAL